MVCRKMGKGGGKETGEEGEVLGFKGFQYKDRDIVGLGSGTLTGQPEIIKLIGLSEVAYLGYKKRRLGCLDTYSDSNSVSYYIYVGSLKT